MRRSYFFRVIIVRIEIRMFSLVKKEILNEMEIYFIEKVFYFFIKSIEIFFSK